MLFWCMVLFILGLFGIIQDIAIVQQPDTSAHAVTWALMLTVVGILVHVRKKEKRGEKERLKAQVDELERRLRKQRLGH